MTMTSRDVPIWRRIALPASIVLNLFLLALIGGHLWHNRSTDAASGPPLARSLARAEAILPPRDAAAFGAVIRRDLPRYAPAARQLMAARQEVMRQITADPFNPDGLRQSLAAWQTARDRFLDDFSATFVDALAQISPEGRRKLVAERRSLRQELLRP